MARDDGWLAEHMLILKLTSPEGETRYVTGAFPSACGKTNLAMLVPDPSRLEGRDDRRRHLLDEVRLRRAPLRHQPRGRLLRRRAGHQLAHQPQRDVLGRGQHHLHQHRPHRRRRRVVGGHDRRSAGPLHRLAGRGVDAGERARRPRTRTPGSPAPAAQDPAIASEWEDPPGVPDLGDPLRRPARHRSCRSSSQSFDWEHGVFLGSIMASETTAAAAGAVGNLRRDPFAMLPFCGYNMADYFGHWLDIGDSADPDEAAEDLLRQLVPQGRRRQVALAGLRRELAGPRSGSSSGWAARRTPSRPRSVACPPPVRSTPRGSTCREEDMAKLLESTSRSGGQRFRSSASTTRSSVTGFRTR